MNKKKIAIVGATGFTGMELVRILTHHPNVAISAITSESKKGQRFEDLQPHLKGQFSMELSSIDDLKEGDVDLVFLALPHRVSMNFIRDHRNWKIPIIDLSGDFRLDDAPTYEKWYDKEHVIPERVGDAIYGLPELHREAIAKADLIANPGCYPTASILPIAPLVKAGLVDPAWCVIDAKSGITGAGAKSKAVNHFSSVNDNFKAYGLKFHRHSIEIQQQLDHLSPQTVNIQFTPHLLPIDRGILTTSYLRPSGKMSEERLREVYGDFYSDHPFVRRVEDPPQVKYVRGSNYCDIYSTYDERTGNILVMGAIDNLVKGAAGQAVQNMNLRMGWAEETGLQHIPLMP